MNKLLLLAAIAMLCACQSITGTKSIQRDTLPSTTNAYLASAAFVKDHLKVPTSADFDTLAQRPTVIRVSDFGENMIVYKVAHQFQALNPLGVKVRSNYDCVMMYITGDASEKDSWLISSLNIDGQPMKK